jgi:hypothetical protein
LGAPISLARLWSWLVIGAPLIVLVLFIWLATKDLSLPVVVLGMLAALASYLALPACSSASTGDITSARRWRPKGAGVVGWKLFPSLS